MSRRPLNLKYAGYVPDTMSRIPFPGNPQGVLAVPLILRDKLAAILYCDTKQEELPFR